MADSPPGTEIDMIITRNWLMEFTNKGLINKRQLACFGLTYPQPKGWINRLIGTEIDEVHQRQFESLKGMSQHAQSIKNAHDSGQFKAFYVTTPDDKGSWTGRWGNEFRWHFPMIRKKINQQRSRNAVS